MYIYFITSLCIFYIGSTKSKTAPESQPAAAPWSGSSLSGYRKRTVDRPEPLWRPVCEEEGVQGTSSEDSKRCVSKQSQGDTSPPSPRTLKAIQAAINESSDEETVNQDKRDGSVSPRTYLAIQQALAEDKEGAAESRTLINSSPTKLCANTQHHVPQVVISSSEEETERDDVKSLPNEKSDVKGYIPSQSLPIKDTLFVDSSEDEMEERIGLINKALVFAAPQQSHEKEQKLEDATKKRHLTKDVTTGSGGQTEREQLERTEPEHRMMTEKITEFLVPSQSAAASSLNTLSINLSAEGKTKSDHLVPEQTSNKSPEGVKQRHGEDVKSESGEESESEGTVTSQLYITALLLNQ